LELGLIISFLVSSNMARFPTTCFIIAVALNVSLTLGAARKAPVAGTLRKNVTEKSVSSTRVVHAKVLSDGTLPFN
jgi:hypothetical protein